MWLRADCKAANPKLLGSPSPAAIRIITVPAKREHTTIGRGDVGSEESQATQRDRCTDKRDGTGSGEKGG